MSLKFVLLCILHGVFADLSNINVFVRQYVGEKNYKSLFNENINNLVDYKSIILFNCTVNSLEKGDVSNFHNLKELSISGVNLVTLKPKCFSNLPSLSYLYLTTNLLKKIPKGVFNNLKISTLLLNENQIEIIEVQAFDLQTLTVLDLSWNKIKYIDSNWFKDCRNLKELHLAANQLTHVQGNAFRSVKSLTFIDLSKNKIGDMDPDSFVGVRHLRILNLSRNKLSEIPDGIFKDQTNFRILQVLGNQLQCLSDDVLDSLGIHSSVFLAMNRLGKECRSKCKQFNKENKRKHIYY